MARRHVQFILAVLATGLLLESCASPQRADQARSTASAAIGDTVLIELERPLHFMTPAGGERVAPTGVYRVEPDQAGQLRLLPEGQAPLLIAAAPASHDIPLSMPFALVYAEQEDQPHLLLLMPDGQAWDAAGSFSGIRPREASSIRRLFRYETTAMSGKVQSGGDVTGRIPPAAQAAPASPSRQPGGLLEPVGPGSEMSMIELQSVISRRHTALQLTTAIHRAQTEPFRLEHGIDRPGTDYAQRREATPEACRTSCSADQTCQAFTFVKPPTGMSHGQCYLKRAVPAAVRAPCCISGKRKSAQQEIIGNIR